MVIDLAGPGWSRIDLTEVGGIAAGIGLRWLCKLPLPAVIAGAAAVTALLRLAR